MMNWLRKPLGDLGAHVGGRDNNFNLIRFIAAVAVLFSHSFALSVGKSSAEPLRIALDVTFGQIAVDIFFLTSGFLVTASLIARGSLRAFASARCLRIYPGLAIAVLVTTALVGWNFTSLSPRDFFSSGDTWRYVLMNSTMLAGEMHTLPGAFENTPWRHLVNASLWTLPYELAMYCTLGVLWLILSTRRGGEHLRWVNLIIAIGATTGLLALQGYVESNALRLTAMFFVGSAFYAFRCAIPMNAAFFAALVGAIAVAGFSGHFFKFVYIVSVPYVVFFLAYIPNGTVRKFNKFGDYSYGLYIYAWPIQQMTAAALPGIEPLRMLGVSFVFTMMLAFTSWTFIEKPALALKTRRLTTSVA